MVISAPVTCTGELSTVSHNPFAGFQEIVWKSSKDDHGSLYNFCESLYQSGMCNDAGILFMIWWKTSDI